MKLAVLLALTTLVGLPARPAGREQGPLATRSPFDELHFRDIGPAATGGRIHDLQVDPKNPAILYVGAATGGIWKSTNKGLTWKDIFGHQPDNTFGALAIFERDTKIIWAGTGEQNNRQSSSWGGGVYRSTDAGETWTYLGLHDTRSIGRVVLDPVDPSVAYIAAVGNLWAGNTERGVYKTTDAGRTWSKALFVDQFTGATDLVMDPRDSKVLYAATYQRLRKAFGFNGGGPGSAIYKTRDGGTTWFKLENGIPTGDKGRIGLALALSKPDVLVATIEHATAGGTYRTEDAGVSWKRMSATNPRPMYYSKPTIDPNNDKRIWLPGTYIVKSEDGGTTFQEEPTSPTYDVGLKTDHHVVRVDPANSSHIYVVGDGGLHESFDMGKTYMRVNNIPVAQVYRIAVDNRDPYWVYAGLQDNHSWMGPSATRHWLGILNQDWVEIGFSDGTGKAVDKTDGRKVYSSSSGGNLSLVDPITGDTVGITPRPPAGEPPYRFDWDAPVMASRHTSGTVYLGGNKLFISKDFGSSWTATKDLTRSINRDSLEMMGVLNRDIRLSRNDGDAISEISNFAESPLDPNILWVGTDDGNVQLTIDGGTTWTELSGAITGVKNGTFVGDIVASSASSGTAFVSFDAHRDGDFAPYLFKTTDFGKTWTAVTSGLPADDASIRGLAEFPGKPNVLFAGTERALFVTHDSGAHWTRLAANLPTTRYDDILVHPRTKDLVLGTHGRGIWILDDASPIAEWTPAIAAKRAHLFDVPRATLMLYWEDVSNMDHYFFAAENPAEGAAFTYTLAQPAQKVRLVVTNPAGRVIREVTGSGDASVIHRVNWDLRFPAPAGGGRGGGGGGEEGGGPGAQRAGVVQLPIPAHDIGTRGPLVAPGTFKVTLQVDGVATESKMFDVRADPASNVTLLQHKAREAFVMEVMDLVAKVDALAASVRTRAAAATGDEATRLQAIIQRLVGSSGGGGRGGGRGGGGAQPLRQRIAGLLSAYLSSGAQTGTLIAPTVVMKTGLAEAKADLAAVLSAQTSAPTTHRLEATPKTVAYGYYWSAAEPVLRIKSGDIIDVDTLLTNSPAGLARAGVPDAKIQDSLKAITAAFPNGDPGRGPGGHILTGPVFVEGAEPGDTLEVKILSIDLPIDYGYNGCSGFVPGNCGPQAGRTKIIQLDKKTMTAEFMPGIIIPLKPFFGSMGVAPAPELGRVSSNPPGKHAGNMDNRELVAGSTLFIPVFAAGALFEIGDGHAAQGDGEVDQTAIETSLRGKLQLTVRKDIKLTWPRAETATDYISMATDPDLAIATTGAIQEMVDFLAATKGLTKQEAYQLVSIAGNVAITQLVDKPNLGVHVKIPKSLFKR